MSPPAARRGAEAGFRIPRRPARSTPHWRDGYCHRDRLYGDRTKPADSRAGRIGRRHDAAGRCAIMIDSREASAALADIDDIVGRVRQSRIYNLASQMMIMWGVLVFAGYLVTYLVPRYAFYGWTAVYVVGIAGWALLSTSIQSQSGVRTFGVKFLLAFAMLFAFGIFCCMLGQ